MPVIVHEAPYSDGYPHTCGSNDRSLEEMGGGPSNYKARLKGRADMILENHICLK